MRTLYPTHHCFDDALDYLTELALDPSTAWIIRAPDTFLVHGIALMPETGGLSAPGTPYAHAWVELGGDVIQAGLLASGERIFYRKPKAEHYAKLRIQHATRYTMRQALEENRRSNNYGPWKPEYLARVRQQSSTGETAVDV